MARRLRLAGPMEMEGKLPDCDADGELYDNQLLMAEQVAAARPGSAIRMGDLIKKSLFATISSGLSRRSLECQRHSRRNAPGQVD